MTSSAPALVDVLAAERRAASSPRRSRSSTRSRSLSFSVLGIDFEITRITLILLIATAGDPRLLLVAAVRNAAIVPGKLQFLGETGYSLVRDGIARDVIGPKGLPFAPFLGVAVLLHPREQR